ncbi:rod shape-determining protein MreC [Weissella ceti]|uniref:Cell shape-determining protein MreC n=1 Tax=Weissella ceti TaxID=759620 RepID=A0ABT3E2K9_9LACO|nr:rod shape-determining protein MreC [Weissella ceti]MCW0952649.1 rod shape-determining protein MreC [Weissella ceti]QVK12354.1 rod shape-determining protein MreC [Weissella ceti]
MKKLFTSRRLVVGVILVIITIGMITLSSRARANQENPALPVRIVTDISSWMSEVVNTPLKVVGNATEATTKLFKTYQENERLNQRIDDLAATKVELQTVRKENDALKEQLKIGKTLTDYQMVNATVVSRSPNNWQSELIINQGAKAGIKKNMAVMGGGSVIGRVSEVDTTNAKVELLSDNSQTNNRFAIRITNKDSQTVDGIITKFNQTRNLIEMKNVTSNTKVKKGDKVSTSGLGGVTPSGLYVGEVESIDDDDYGLTKTIYIKPATDFNNIPVVSVAIPGA